MKHDKKPKKVGPFLLYVQDLQKIYRDRCGRFVPVREATALAGERWPHISAEEKESYRQRAETYNQSQVLGSRLQGIEENLKAFSLPTMVDTFINSQNRQQFQILRTEFVMISMETPFMKGSVFYPSEVCLVKWSILEGIIQTYRVLLTPNIEKDARARTKDTWPSWKTRESCTDFEVVAREILDFMGPMTFLLGRTSSITTMESAIEYIFSKTEYFRPRIIDQVTVMHRLMLNDKSVKKVNYHGLADIFPTNTGHSAVGIDAEGVHTSIRCSWHFSSTFCPARRAVEDAFIISNELAETYTCHRRIGRHSPVAGSILPEYPHRCSRQMNVAEILGLLCPST